MINAQYEVMGDLKARDWVAVMALQGLLANPSTGPLANKPLLTELAQVAYECADAMLKQSQQSA